MNIDITKGTAAVENLKSASKPLMDYLRDNYNPHVKVIVDSESAELMEGIHCYRVPQPTPVKVSAQQVTV